jgi:competence protein ComEC
MNDISFSVTDNIQVSVIETAILYISFIAFAIWLLRKYKTAFHIGLSAMVVFIVVRSFDISAKGRQQKLIVYNVPQHSAIDFIDGRQYKFIGDTAVLTDNFMQNFHLKPSRTIHRIEPAENLASLKTAYPFLLFKQQKVLLIDQPLKFISDTKIPVDVLILSKNPRIYINELAAVFDCKQIVFDASNPLWKIKLWKKDCDSLRLPHHSVGDKGAYELDL